MDLSNIQYEVIDQPIGEVAKEWKIHDDMAEVKYQKAEIDS